MLFVIASGAKQSHGEYLGDCGACSERSEESPGLLRLRLATATLLAMTKRNVCERLAIAFATLTRYGAVLKL